MKMFPLRISLLSKPIKENWDPASARSALWSWINEIKLQALDKKAGFSRNYSQLFLSTHWHDKKVTGKLRGNSTIVHIDEADSLDLRMCAAHFAIISKANDKKLEQIGAEN